VKGKQFLRWCVTYTPTSAGANCEDTGSVAIAGWSAYPWNYGIPTKQPTQNAPPHDESGAGCFPRLVRSASLGVNDETFYVDDEERIQFRHILNWPRFFKCWREVPSPRTLGRHFGICEVRTDHK